MKTYTVEEFVDKFISIAPNISWSRFVNYSKHETNFVGVINDVSVKIKKHCVFYVNETRYRIFVKLDDLVLYENNSPYQEDIPKIVELFESLENIALMQKQQKLDSTCQKLFNENF